MDVDVSEFDDLRGLHPENAQELLAGWSARADRVGVIPFGRIEGLYTLRSRPSSGAVR